MVVCGLRRKIVIDPTDYGKETMFLYEEEHGDPALDLHEMHRHNVEIIARCIAYAQPEPRIALTPQIEIMLAEKLIEVTTAQNAFGLMDRLRMGFSWAARPTTTVEVAILYGTKAIAALPSDVQTAIATSPEYLAYEERVQPILEAIDGAA